MAVFWQYWYWYPLVPFLSLSFEPTMVMALNSDLAMPKMTFRSNAPSSLYAYPESLKEEEAQEKKTLEKAVLSITAKQKARDLKKEKTKKQNEEGGSGDNGPDVDMLERTISQASTTEATQNDTTKDKEGTEETITGAETKEPEKEKTFEILQNPSRVTLNQRKSMRWEDTRYQSVRKNNNDGKLYGIIIVQDSSPDQPQELVETKRLDDRGVHGNEPAPPKPFKYLGP
ncbi:hypothetical protein RFI_35468 [Reticulomyxa filosa]|uniref:26S proteasome regulatory subunit RPN2 C-terminal domain-containing protein n=1 Tax=Reticulomyxa filosa TaxID=46433 RepID=X6LKU2_RETFI|nr:hypothetical protein RFI_35468 [Reticulomyxa filosa]|eukprot:ETO01971.1 hypothetical protein RFI_35468 [Reticulomyxa filosa]